MDTVNIFKGSTPTLRFNLDVSTNDISVVDISLVNGTIKYSWDKSKCAVAQTSLSVKMTQKQTMDLSVNERCYIQLRVKFSTTDVSVSKVFFCKVMPWIGTEDIL